MTAKISKIILALCGLGGLYLSAFQRDDTVTLFARREGSIASIATVIKGTPTFEALLALYRRLTASRDVIVQLQVYSNREFAVSTLSGKGATDLDERTWYPRYLAALAHRPQGAMCELLQVGPDVAARIVFDGKITEKIIRGENPYLCDGRSPDCAIIWISIGRIPPDEDLNSSQPMVHLFVRTKVKLSKTAAAETAKRLQTKFLSKFLVVAFRSDDWFVNDLEFPIINPFGPIPASEDYRTIKVRDDVMCVASEGGFRCQ